MGLKAWVVIDQDGDRVDNRAMFTVKQAWSRAAIHFTRNRMAILEEMIVAMKAHSWRCVELVEKEWQDG